MARAKSAGKATAKRATKTAAKMPASSTRSRKAPAQAAVGPVKAQAKRRQPSAVVAVRKDTTILQTTEGPRVAWSASKPMFQKR
jgi:hypothetical protein